MLSVFCWFSHFFFFFLYKTSNFYNMRDCYNFLLNHSFTSVLFAHILLYNLVEWLIEFCAKPNGKFEYVYCVSMKLYSCVIHCLCSNKSDVIFLSQPVKQQIVEDFYCSLCQNKLICIKLTMFSVFYKI